jgi:hypothetical protein
MITFTLSYLDEDTGEPVRESFPAVWEICDNCLGDGKTDPLAFAGGFTRAALDEEEFRERYFAGAFDVTCEHCNGRGSIKEPDMDRIESDPSLARRFAFVCERARSDARGFAEIDAAHAAERRAGA